MHHTKTLGLDGMPPLFYHKYWHVVGKSISDSIFHALWTDQIPFGSNYTFLTLIPKKHKVCYVANLCPISLCNIFYRIISEVLANRLKVLLPNLISETQSAFVLGCQITDNILVAYELIHYFCRKKEVKQGICS